MLLLGNQPLQISICDPVHFKLDLHRCLFCNHLALIETINALFPSFTALFPTL